MATSEIILTHSNIIYSYIFHQSLIRYNSNFFQVCLSAPNENGQNKLNTTSEEEEINPNSTVILSSKRDLTQSFTTQSSVEEQNENTGDMNGTIILSKGVVIQTVFFNLVPLFKKFNKIIASNCQPKGSQIHDRKFSTQQFRSLKQFNLEVG